MIRTCALLLSCLLSVSADIAPSVTATNILGSINYNGTHAATLNEMDDSSLVGATKIDITTNLPYGPYTLASDTQSPEATPPQPGAEYVNLVNQLGLHVPGVNGVTSLYTGSGIPKFTVFGSVPYNVSEVYIQFFMNQYVTEVKYDSYQNSAYSNITCDPCSATTCSTYSLKTKGGRLSQCAKLAGRVYTLSLETGTQGFEVTVYDYVAVGFGQQGDSHTVTYTFLITRESDPTDAPTTSATASPSTSSPTTQEPTTSSSTSSPDVTTAPSTAASTSDPTAANTVAPTTVPVATEAMVIGGEARSSTGAVYILNSTTTTEYTVVADPVTSGGTRVVDIAVGAATAGLFLLFVAVFFFVRRSRVSEGLPVVDKKVTAADAAVASGDVEAKKAQQHLLEHSHCSPLCHLAVIVCQN